MAVVLVSLGFCKRPGKGVFSTFFQDKENGPRGPLKFPTVQCSVIVFLGSRWETGDTRVLQGSDTSN